ncbi:MAG: ParB/RepB/Spo0J family partition protein [Crocinitomicaceae bacterium]
MSSKIKKKSALGKGLGALLENASTDITTKKNNQETVVGSIAMLSIGSIEVNPFNPRTHFEEEALNELAESIKTHGIIQPLTVRKMGRDNYQLISGERRFRASQLAGLTEVPAYIRIANDQTMLEMALVENIQREDLNAIEVALSYQRLLEECNLTQEQLSQKIAKGRSSITNHLRLLKLPAEIQAGVRDNLISMGHARALVSAVDETFQIAVFNKILLEGLSVRDVEIIIRQGHLNQEESDGEQDVEKEDNKKDKKPSLESNQLAFKNNFSQKLSSKIDLKKTPDGNGKIIIHFDSDVDLNRIIELLNNA